MGDGDRGVEGQPEEVAEVFAEGGAGVIIDVRRSPFLERRFQIIDARTGLDARRGHDWLTTIWVDDTAHALGVVLVTDVLQGINRITTIKAPKVVIDMGRNTILIHVEDKSVHREAVERLYA